VNLIAELLSSRESRFFEKNDRSRVDVLGYHEIQKVLRVIGFDMLRVHLGRHKRLVETKLSGVIEGSADVKLGADIGSQTGPRKALQGLSKVFFTARLRYQGHVKVERFGHFHLDLQGSSDPSGFVVSIEMKPQKTKQEKTFLWAKNAISGIV